MLKQGIRALAVAALLWAAPSLAQPAAQSTWNSTLERKCAAKDAAACWTLGETLTAGRGVAADPAKALGAFTRACDLTVAEACYIAASRTSSAGNPSGAFALFKKGCEAGLGDSCLSAAIRTETGNGVPADPRLALAYYERACTLREGDSCHYLAQIWGSGEKGERRVDIRKSMQFAEMGCTAGRADSCVLAGWLAQGNLGYPKNETVADRFSQLGCNMNHHGGCMNLGYLAGERRDWLTAKKWYGRACAINRDPTACKAERDIDEYLSDRAQYDAQWAEWNRKQAAGKAQVDGFLARGDYAGAINHASYVMGSPEQVSRVLMAAQSAGKIDEIGDIYFVSFQTWQLTAPANQLVRTEKHRRDNRPREVIQLSPVYGGSSWSWTPSSSSSSSSSTTSYSAPRISESEIYRNARENTRSSYCNAGWGCR
ncbi:tetratricopeptide repeat protein [Sphingomonas sp. AOB5]|uniref:tetratricopeptide repeat protein n=1 Tax=Sphingomonas sp. AOB5 TaxID=3034017 RepID=UPI0023F6AC27|nr:tetratricopeptide repeat protein [Sphingomonas sp. AOB5]MDF7776245.1 tetratricopeptide repeat protein [Sphingomonas sp. AOB5]